MKRPSLLALVLPCVAAVCLDAASPNTATVRKIFRDPPRSYATAPLWVWNDRLTEDQIRSTLRDLAGQDVRQAFVHPRPGLMTPYLSPEWFKLWKAALDEAARLDMNIWIYDENSYPSGFAGGFVPEEMPESRGRGLHWRESAAAPAWATNLLGVFQLGDPGAQDVTASVRTGAALPAGRYLAAVMERAGNSPWHGDRSYVDLLYPGVTEKFLDVTLGAYQREIGSQFGKRVPGSFTDEPNIIPAGGWPWTADLPQQFEQRRGYALLPQLAALKTETGDWRRVRHDYFRTLLELFIERWAQPYMERCTQLGLDFTGHYWEHDWPHCIGVPDNMAMSAWQHRPGIDTLMNQYSEDTHAQFGNIRAPREILSIANQLGRSRTLVELYGAGGWDLRFEDMKRIGDWLVVLGVNTLDEHLSYVTLRGARKRDHPQSFSYHEPWWDSYHVIARHLTRLCAAMSQGEQINRILVLEPTTTAWMYQGQDPQLKGLGDAFATLVKSLEAAQIEYDLGCEDVIARHGSVENPAGRMPAFRVGRRAYEVVALPPGTENLESSTALLVERFLAAGGKVLATDDPPNRVDGVATDRLQTLARSGGWIRTSATDLAATLARTCPPTGLSIVRDAGDEGLLFHHRRQLADGELLLLVNTSLAHPTSGALETKAGSIEEWDTFTGKVEPAGFEKSATGTTLRYTVRPGGSRLFALRPGEAKPRRASPPPAITFSAAGPTEVQRLDLNVLTLDYVDVTAGGETRSNVYFYAANQFAWQKNGLARDPWDSAVQFKDELISRTFPADSGFTATYRFTLQGAVPPHLEIVVERPDLYSITCNGREVTATPGAWWLDQAFGRIPLAFAAQPGENTVTLSARPFTMLHELEPAYLRGDFGLEPAPRGFTVVAAKPLTVDRKGWNAQGQPFYAGTVVYRQEIPVSRKMDRYYVELPAWYGSVARIKVNGRLAGHVIHSPDRCDITPDVKKGRNIIEVEVVGTMKNLLGPHHAGQGRGSAWPGMFQQSPKEGQPPGDRYDNISYGLFEPFKVVQEGRL